MYANSNVHNSLHYDKINANVNKNTLRAWCDKRAKPSLLLNVAAMDTIMITLPYFKYF